MTIKEIIAELHPEMINPDANGGVYNCPHDYEELHGKYKKLYCTTFEGCKLCNKCWNQKYKSN